MRANPERRDMSASKRVRDSSRVGNLIFGAFWNGILLVMAVIIASSGAPSIVWVFWSFFAVIGVGLVVWALLPMIASTTIGRPVVVVSSETVRVGEAFTIAYQQTFKRSVNVEHIIIQFVLRETVTYRRGTDVEIVSHDRMMEQFDHLGRRYEAGQRFDDTRTLRVPDDGMHTFIARRNKVQWFVKAQVKVAGWPDIKEEYEIKVLPERCR
jgi:hypothetical protein